MLTIKSLLLIVLSLLLLPSFSLADTFVVTNLNDPGAGSMRQAITNSNLNPGPDEIVFEEGLEGTIVLNLGQFDISDDLTITGPGAIKIIVDADGKSRIFFIQDWDSEINKVVNISGLQFINGTEYYGGIIQNHENLSVENCEFINSNSDTASGGAIDNYKILTVNSCLFDNNSAFYGGAISNNGEGVNVKILDSEFRNNKAQYGAVIRNQGSIDVIANSTFTNNIAGDHGGVIQNDFCNVTCLGTIKVISNSTFSDNRAVTGSAIRNHGLINISFTTIANNLSLPLPPDSIFTMERAGIVRLEMVLPVFATRYLHPTHLIIVLEFLTISEETTQMISLANYLGMEQRLF